MFDHRGWKFGHRAALKDQRRYDATIVGIQQRRNPVRSIFSWLWACFWIGLAIWLVTGGAEARHAIWDMFQLVRHLSSDVLDSLLR